MKIIAKARKFLFEFSYFEKKYYLDGEFAKLFGRLFYRRMFKSFGAGTKLKKPDQVFNPKNISIGRNVSIERGSVLYSVGTYGENEHNGKIVIGDNVYLNRGFNASSAVSIIIGDGVACGSNVFINDFSHGYEDISIGMIESPLTTKGPVEIGRNSWLGANVFVGSGVSIGEHCIIAANSVVTSSVPPYSVVAGIPAKVIKKFNIQNQSWEKAA